MVADIALDGAAGSVIPGVDNLILSYKQQRIEKNLEIFISQIVVRQDEFNERLSKLDFDKIQQLTKHYFGIVADYVLDVRQQDKIDFIVNGYINMTEMEDLNDDSVIMFYDTLDQMTLMDIAVLKSHHRNFVNDEKNGDYLERLVPGQRQLVHEKLLRLGLVSSEHERKRDSNVQNIVSYLQDIQKGKKNVKLKSDKIWGSDSYRLTKYGQNFIAFFLNQSSDETETS